MDLKNKHVAVICNSNGRCISLSTVRIVNKAEFDKLSKERDEYNNKLEEEKLEIKKALTSRGKDIVKLYRRDLIIAKAQYDRFVDRGFLDENKEFDKKFYDYIVNDEPLTKDDYPEDFKKILEKVVNL